MITSTVSTENKTLDDRANPQLFPSKISRVLVETIENLLQVQTDADISYLLQRHVRQLIPHEISICGLGDASTLRIDYLINNGYPESFLSSITSNTKSDSNKVVVNSPVVKAARRSANGLVVVNDTMVYQPDYEQWTEAVKKHFIINMIAKQKLQHHSRQMSYFCFANFSGPVSPLQYRLLDILAPNLDFALQNIINHQKKCLPLGITAREQEILSYLFQGLTNKHIAKQLEISQFTVKNHIHNILEKLNATNRVQALAIALSQGIIDHT